MRTAPVLLWILGSVWLWDSAQGAAIGGLEDEIVTPGTDNGMVTPGLEDKIATTGATEEPSVSTSKAERALTSTESRTKSAIEDLPTPGGSDHGHEENKGTTTVRVVTSHSVDKKTSHPDRDNTAGETETTDKKGGLAIVTLVGIIVGVLLAIGFIGGIIIVIMRKISGRFSHQRQVVLEKHLSRSQTPVLMRNYTGPKELPESCQSPNISEKESLQFPSSLSSACGRR